ncbi:MAG: L-serine ammonia-lyase, iron-sulfur-dependent subunit beta [Acidaminobacteraceae bacterium]
MANYSIFDIVGPIMIGPSSSHTAGASRIGFIASKLIRSKIENVNFYLHGSFAKTYRGHGTDKAVLAGVLGIKEDDERLRDAFNIADKMGVTYSFEEIDLGDVHPNTVKIVVELENKATVEVVGSSIGGGAIEIIEINNIKLSITGENPTLIAKHGSLKGLIAGFANVLNQNDYDIKYMSFYEGTSSSDGIIVVELDRFVTSEILDLIANSIDGIKDVFLI